MQLKDKDIKNKKEDIKFEYKESGSSRLIKSNADVSDAYTGPVDKILQISEVSIYFYNEEGSVLSVVNLSEKGRSDFLNGGFDICNIDNYKQDSEFYCEKNPGNLIAQLNKAGKFYIQPYYCYSDWSYWLHRDGNWFIEYPKSQLFTWTPLK